MFRYPSPELLLPSALGTSVLDYKSGLPSHENLKEVREDQDQLHHLHRREQDPRHCLRYLCQEGQQ